MLHTTATIDDGAKIGKNSNVWHYSHIREDSVIGNDCNIGQNCYVDKGAKIGNNVKIQNNVSVWHGVTIEDDCFIGPCVTFTNDLYPRAFIWSDNRVETTIVKKGASVGANSTIVCGKRVIGEYALVAAGSVVTKDVPDHGMVRGNPARLVGFVCKCGHKLEKKRNESEFIVMVCSDKECKFKEEYKIRRDIHEMI
jgi:acetyltransferase-like isoleucine patch superfamily enzyme